MLTGCNTGRKDKILQNEKCRLIFGVFVLFGFCFYFYFFIIIIFCANTFSDYSKQLSVITFTCHVTRHLSETWHISSSSCFSENNPAY